MNILIFFGNQINPQNGGTERVASIISTYLSENGHRVFFMACHKNPGEKSVESIFLPDEVELPTSNNIEFVNRFIKQQGINVIINEGGYGDAIHLFSHEYIPEDIKIISHIHFDPAGGNKTFYKTLNLPLNGINLSLKFRNALKWIKAPYNKFQFIKDKRDRFRKINSNSDKIVFLKDSHIEDFRKISEIEDSSKLVVIKNPLTFITEPVSVRSKDNTLLFVGRLDYNSKRVDRVLNVWSKLQSKFKDWNLTIVGDGPDRNRLERICTQKRIERVIFTGKTDSKPYYKRAKILLMTSNYEGCPMVIPEAMAFGVVPVIMNTFSGCDDVIVNGFNGIICKPFDIDDMVSEIENIISAPQTFISLSKNAILSISKINNSTVLNKWLDVIQ